MARLVAGELIKVRTTRTALGFAAASLLLVLASVLITILAGHPATVVDKRGALNFGGAIALVLLLFGAVAATGEFRHRTLAPAVLIAPDRLRLLLARIAAYAVTALALAVAMAVITLALGIPLLAGEKGPDLTTSDYVDLVAGGLVVATLAAALGVAFGTLVRNQVFAVIAVLVWVTILEPLTGLIDDRLPDYSLGSTLNRVAQGGDENLGFASAVLVLLAWATVFLGAAAVVDQRRDVE
ncbi:MAG: type transport system permease protein [Solirubrobacteraceae bacterium]|nr:type transport system permease protein [Solirubrobacteraceae bacterium]